MSKVKDMIDRDAEDQWNTIQEILMEASSYGLRGEVEDWAEKLLRDDPEMNIVDAYNEAFYEWIK